MQRDIIDTNKAAIPQHFLKWWGMAKRGPIRQLQGAPNQAQWSSQTSCLPRIISFPARGPFRNIIGRHGSGNAITLRQLTA
jgi:hypothetical protein